MTLRTKTTEGAGVSAPIKDSTKGFTGERVLPSEPLYYPYPLDYVLELGNVLDGWILRLKGGYGGTTPGEVSILQNIAYSLDNTLLAYHEEWARVMPELLELASGNARAIYYAGKWAYRWERYVRSELDAGNISVAFALEMLKPVRFLYPFRSLPPKHPEMIDAAQSGWFDVPEASANVKVPGLSCVAHTLPESEKELLDFYKDQLACGKALVDYMAVSETLSTGDLDSVRVPTGEFKPVYKRVNEPKDLVNPMDVPWITYTRIDVSTSGGGGSSRGSGLKLEPWRDYTSDGGFDKDATSGTEVSIVDASSSGATVTVFAPTVGGGGGAGAGAGGGATTPQAVNAGLAQALIPGVLEHLETLISLGLVASPLVYDALAKLSSRALDEGLKYANISRTARLNHALGNLARETQISHTMGREILKILQDTLIKNRGISRYSDEFFDVLVKLGHYSNPLCGIATEMGSAARDRVVALLAPHISKGYAARWNDMDDAARQVRIWLRRLEPAIRKADMWERAVRAGSWVKTSPLPTVGRFASGALAVIGTVDLIMEVTKVSQFGAGIPGRLVRNGFLRIDGWDPRKDFTNLPELWDGGRPVEINILGMSFDGESSSFLESWIEAAYALFFVWENEPPLPPPAVDLQVGSGKTSPLGSGVPEGVSKGWTFLEDEDSYWSPFDGFDESWLGDSSLDWISTGPTFPILGDDGVPLATSEKRGWAGGDIRESVPLEDSDPEECDPEESESEDASDSNDHTGSGCDAGRGPFAESSMIHITCTEGGGLGVSWGPWKDDRRSKSGHATEETVVTGSTTALNVPRRGSSGKP